MPSKGPPPRRPGRPGQTADANILGILLLVAFAVVMSAAMLLLYRGLTEDIQDPALVTFTKDAAGPGGLVIVQHVGSTGIRVGDLEIMPEAGTCTYQDAQGTAKTSGTVVAGDRWSCTDDGVVKVRHVPSNTLLYETLL